jgi:hypothetical protein
MKLLIGLLCAVPLAAQWQAVPGTQYPALEAILNAKPAVQASAGAASGNCTAGKDLWLDTTGHVLYYCSATNTWLAVADVSNTQTLTNKTIDGVSPTTMGYLDATSSIQTQLNSKVATTITINGHALSGNVVVSASDITTGTLPVGQLPTAAVTKDGSGNVAISAIVPVTISTSGPVTTAGSGFWINNASGALTYNLPTITSALVGIQQCFRNAVTKTGAITLTAPASTYFDVNGAVGSAAGTLVSGGALGDAACVVAIDTTHYYAYTSAGSWTNN